MQGTLDLADTLFYCATYAIKRTHLILQHAIIFLLLLPSKVFTTCRAHAAEFMHVAGFNNWHDSGGSNGGSAIPPLPG